MLYPLKFESILQRKIWGGSKLFSLLNKGSSDIQDLGETWELSDNDRVQSKICNGALAGQSFRDVFKENGESILGRDYTTNGGSFPLLYKFIDAKENLSVQVHPGENSSLGDSKTETWVVVDAIVGAEIIVGIDSKESPNSILEKLKTSEAKQVLNHIPVKKGDILFIPSGTVHAITAGIVIYEVQQNSDTTFRLYDWDRVDDRGHSRELHLKQAAEVIDYEVHQKHKMKPLEIVLKTAKKEFLVACPNFCLIRLTQIQQLDISTNNHFAVFTCLLGKVELRGVFGSEFLECGETVLIPAECGLISMDEKEVSTVIYSFIPDLDSDVVKPLEQAGYSINEIKNLGGKNPQW